MTNFVIIKNVNMECWYTVEAETIDGNLVEFDYKTSGKVFHVPNLPNNTVAIQKISKRDLDRVLDYDGEEDSDFGCWVYKHGKTFYTTTMWNQHDKPEWAEHYWIDIETK